MTRPRAFSIPMLPFEDRARWLFLKKKATQLPGFCKEQNRKCCSCPAAEPVGKPSGRASAIGSKSKPIAFGLVGACSQDDSAAVGADVHRSKGAHGAVSAPVFRGVLADGYIQAVGIAGIKADGLRASVPPGRRADPIQQRHPLGVVRSPAVGAAHVGARIHQARLFGMKVQSRNVASGHNLHIASRISMPGSRGDRQGDAVCGGVVVGGVCGCKGSGERGSSCGRQHRARGWQVAETACDADRRVQLRGTQGGSHRNRRWCSPGDGWGGLRGRRTGGGTAATSSAKQRSDTEGSSEICSQNATLSFIKKLLLLLRRWNCLICIAKYCATCINRFTTATCLPGPGFTVSIQQH
jgi:hypothetical protein